MSSQSLLVIVDADATTDHPPAVVGRALGHWSATDRPPVRIQPIDALIESGQALDGTAAVWLVLETTGCAVLHEALGQVADHHLPAMLTAPGADQPVGTAVEHGITCCPPGTPDGTACVMLRTLWNQAATLAELREERTMLEAQKGGLAGQIDRMDEELRLAAQLQREFLPPSLPSAPGLDFHVFWRPAGYVSGDIYDVSKLDENHVGVFLADAVGHGVPAALMTMYIKRSLHTKVIDSSLPAGYRLVEPHETLTQLNEDLIAQQGDQVRFATACYAVIDCRTRRICLARAGHPPPIVLRASGESEYFEPDGGLLGIFPDAEFEQQCFQLEPNDRMLVYSDGFEMAFDDPAGDKSKVANDQYCREFEAMRRGSLNDAVQHLEHRLDSQAGSLNQRDDLTALCVGATNDALIDDAPLEARNENGERLRHRLAAPSPVA